MRPQEVGGEVRVYYGASAGRHNAESSGEATLGLALFQPDRLAGLAPKGGCVGTLSTEVFTPEGRELLLNADAAQGRVTVELCDAEGSPLPGFAREDSVPFMGDELGAPLIWKAGKFPGVVEKRAVRLRLFLESATVYALYSG